MTAISNVEEAMKQVLEHLAHETRNVVAERVGREDLDLFTKLFGELLANEVVQLWISKQIAHLTGQVH